MLGNAVHILTTHFLYIEIRDEFARNISNLRELLCNSRIVDLETIKLCIYFGRSPCSLIEENRNFSVCWRRLGKTVTASR